MNAERWEEVQITFDELVELDATERVGRLASLAIEDPELHRALESLLQADEDADAQLAPIDAAVLLGSARQSDPLGVAGRTISHSISTRPSGQEAWASSIAPTTCAWVAQWL